MGLEGESAINRPREDKAIQDSEVTGDKEVASSTALSLVRLSLVRNTHDLVWFCLEPALSAHSALLLVLGLHMYCVELSWETNCCFSASREMTKRINY